MRRYLYLVRTDQGVVSIGVAETLSGVARRLAWERLVGDGYTGVVVPARAADICRCDWEQGASLVYAVRAPLLAA